MNFLFPEKPNRIYSEGVVPDNYLFQYKKDGHRAIILIKEDNVEIYNRHGNILNASKNFDWNWLKDIFPKNTMLDGEIVGARQAGELNDTIVIWDIVYENNVSLIDLSYKERWEKLFQYTSKEIKTTKKSIGTIFIAENNNTEIYLSNNYQKCNFKNEWNKLDKIFDEGIVFKNPDSKLSWNIFGTKTTSNQLKILAK